MKKTILLLFMLSSLFQIEAQTKYFTKSGTIIFESSVASFEEVKATNNKVSAVLKDDGTFASLVLLKGFRFKIALMEEHFNENYMESGKYPKSSFSGKIKSFSINDLTTNFKEYEIEGTLKMRGVSQKIITKCELKKNGETIVLKTSFNTKPEDFNIKIPKIVRPKIAEKVDVTAEFILKKK